MSTPSVRAHPGSSRAATARHGPWVPARGGVHLAEWAAEFLGTAILVLGGLSAVVLDFGAGSPVARAVPGASPRLLLTGALFAGTGALVTISPIGRRSGAHLNPAVTLGFWLTGHVHTVDLVGYVVGQVLGALAGAAALVAVWGARAAPVHDGLTQPAPGVSAPVAAALEAVMTGAMILAILLMVSSPRTMRWTPLVVWAVVTVEVWQGAPFTGTSLNPARSFGPAVMTGDFHAYWVYVVGPLAGAVAAVTIQRFALPDVVPLSAKLFHVAGDYSTSLGHFPSAVRRSEAG
ncbi:MAG: aquaporin [Chloroflexi bacterium]|nr:aquaporin [Chloroflexota bacterium]